MNAACAVAVTAALLAITSAHDGTTRIPTFEWSQTVDKARIEVLIPGGTR